MSIEAAFAEYDRYVWELVGNRCSPLHRMLPLPLAITGIDHTAILMSFAPLRDRSGKIDRNELENILSTYCKCSHMFSTVEPSTSFRRVCVYLRGLGSGAHQREGQ